MTGVLARAAGAWGGWEAWCAREEPAAGQFWMRTLVCGVALLQFVWVGAYGLVDTVYVPWELGGITHATAHSYVLDDLFGAYGGRVAWGVVILGLGAALAGIRMRWALLVALLAWAQLGHLYGPADRAIDRILRTALLILVFSDLPTWRDVRAGRRVKAWPADLVRCVMVIVYLSAGIGKLAATPRWLSPGESGALYRAVADPLSGNVDPATAAKAMWLWKAGGVYTIVVELLSPLLLTRWARWWAPFAIAMHVGIAMTMDLGWFPWGMLGLYGGGASLWGAGSSLRRQGQ